MGDQGRVGGEVVGLGPVGQVHAGTTGQGGVDLLHHHREERRGHPGEGHQDRVEGVVGIALVGVVGGCRLRPEPVPAAADVPVVERVDEPLDLMGGARQVVGVHPFAHRLHQRADLGEQVTVQQPGGVGPHRGPVPVDVGVQGEEAVGVPDGQQHLAHHVVDAGIGDPQVATPEDGRRHQVPTQGVGPLVVEDDRRLGVVAQLLRQLGAVLGKQDSVAYDVLEGRPVEQGGGKDVQRVEPAAGLVYVLDDEVGREVLVKPLTVLERVVHLRERHRARLEPAVQDLRYPAHRRRTGRVVGVGPGQVVDERPVEVVGPDAEVPLDLVEAAVDVDPRVCRVIAAPDRDG